MQHPTNWLEGCEIDLKVETILIAQTPRNSFTSLVYPTQPIIHGQPFKVQCLSPKEMTDRQKRGLCCNFDEIFFRGHKC